MASAVVGPLCVTLLVLSCGGVTAVAPGAALPNVDQAWKDFQVNMNVRAREGSQTRSDHLAEERIKRAAREKEVKTTQNQDAAAKKRRIQREAGLEQAEIKQSLAMDRIHMEAVEHRRKMQLREQQMRMRRIAKERVGKHNLFREHMVVEHENHELHEKHLHRAVKGPTVETRFKIASRERMHKQEVGLTILHLQQKGKGKANGGKGMAKERFKKKRARRAVDCTTLSRTLSRTLLYLCCTCSSHQLLYPCFVLSFCAD